MLKFAESLEADELLVAVAFDDKLSCSTDEVDVASLQIMLVTGSVKL